jgi:hypothetical protein
VALNGRIEGYLLNWSVVLSDHWRRERLHGKGWFPQRNCRFESRSTGTWLAGWRQSCQPLKTLHPLNSSPKPIHLACKVGDGFVELPVAQGAYLDTHAIFPVPVRFHFRLDSQAVPRFHISTLACGELATYVGWRHTEAGGWWQHCYVQLSRPSRLSFSLRPVPSSAWKFSPLGRYFSYSRRSALEARAQALWEHKWLLHLAPDIVMQVAVDMEFDMCRNSWDLMNDAIQLR